jgi:hypothetical protein
MTINIILSDALPDKISLYENFFRRLPPQWEDYSRQEYRKRATATSVLLVVAEEEIYELSDNKISTKDDQLFIIILE